MPGIRTLDLGSGPNPEGIGMDVISAPGVVTHDMLHIPWPFGDGEFDRVVCHQVLEHLPPVNVGSQDALFAVTDEVWRVLRPRGVFEFDVPHIDSSFAFEDPTHRRFYLPESFEWLWKPRAPPYAKNLWGLVSLKVERTYPFVWHIRKYLPRLAALLDSCWFFVPTKIRVILEKPK